MINTLEKDDAVVVTHGRLIGKAGWVSDAVRTGDAVLVRFPTRDAPIAISIEHLRRLMPAGTRVQFGEKKLTGVVVGPDVALNNDTAYTAESYVNCERVRQDHDGRVLLWHADSITALEEPAPTPAPELWPVGTLVRSKKYGNLGTVVEHRATNPANPADTSITTRVRHEDNGMIASYPSPEEALERVHVLSHGELSVLEDGLRRRDTLAIDRSLTMLNGLLHPKVKRTFTVTVEQPADEPPVDAGTLKMVMKSDDSLAYPVTAISTEENAR